MIPYGSPEWLQRIAAAGYEPVGRARGMIVVRLPWGTLAKVVGGTPESPTLIEIVSPSAEIMAVGAEAGAPGADPAMEVTWLSWYNTVATNRDRDDFDRVATKIDEAGLEAMPGGSEDDLIEPYRWTHPNIYRPLLNYRDTGGRTAVRAKTEELWEPPSEQYGDKPIWRPQEDGPIEPTPSGGIILHRGRYTYSNAMYDTDMAHEHKPEFFPRWLDAAIKAGKVTVLRTQVTEGVLGDIPILNIFSTPYHRDYEFLVRENIAWDTAIPGFATWLPEGADVQSYWGKPTGHSGPSIEPLKEGAEGLAAMLQKLFTLGVVLGAGYVVIQLAKSGRKPAPA